MVGLSYVLKLGISARAGTGGEFSNPNVSGFIAQLVKHRTGNGAKVIVTVFFFRLILQLFKLPHNDDDHIFHSFINLQFNR